MPGDFFSLGSSVSRSQRCFSLSATVFIAKALQRTAFNIRLATRVYPIGDTSMRRRLDFTRALNKETTRKNRIGSSAQIDVVIAPPLSADGTPIAHARRAERRR